MEIPQKVEQPDQASSPQETKSVFWKTFGILLGLGALGTALNLPTNFYGYKLVFAQPIQVVGYIGQQLAIVLVVGSLAIWVGLGLGKPLGLGAPLLRRWLAGDTSAPRQIRSTLPLTLGIAALAFFAQLIIGSIGSGLAYARAEVSFPLWIGVSGGLGAGLTEEILYRLGILTLLLWLGAKIFRQTKAGPALFWPVNIITALLFGSLHIPAALALGLNPVTEALATSAAGLLFGWLYWRLGLFQGMLAHICLDTVGYTIAFVALLFIK